MSESFKVGEVAILQNIIGNPEYNGMEVTIIEGVGRRLMTNISQTRFYFLYSYVIDMKLLGVNVAVPPHCLRKKKPPFKGEQIIRDLFVPVDQPDLVPA
jgi:hypothetical protein